MMNQPLPQSQPLLLGAHMSIAGGVHTAVERAMRIGCTTISMFVKNNTQWKGTTIDDEVRAHFKRLIEQSGVAPVVAHSTYLINLCATNIRILKKSRETLIDELNRCEGLGIQYLNFHPGSHMGAGEEAGIERIAESLNLIHERTKGYRVKSVLEATAGQGTSIGHRFEELRRIIDLVENKRRMAVTIDTCHIFAAGYDLSTEQGYERTMKEFDHVVGFKRLAAFHVNDSKRGLGSRVDRHEHIGKGAIGLVGFRMLMNDERFAHTPKILETPKGEDMKEDVENMNLLKGLINSSVHETVLHHPE
ncbi:MAG: deoxyribonuclease IV [bacterium]